MLSSPKELVYKIMQEDVSNDDGVITHISYHRVVAISVWCERFSANFGEVIIPEAFTGDIPETVASDLQCGAPATTDASTDGPISLGEFTTRAHEVAGTVEIVSDRIIKITDFIYDGTGPAAFFWIDSEPNPSNPTGKIAYDVGGSCGSAALAAFNGDEVFVELPSSVKNYLGGSLSVWVCTYIHCIFLS